MLKSVCRKNNNSYYYDEYRDFFNGGGRVHNDNSKYVVSVMLMGFPYQGGPGLGLILCLYNFPPFSVIVRLMVPDAFHGVWTGL